jgi:hypothetical protein
MSISKYQYYGGRMPELRSMESVRADITKVEPEVGMGGTSPALNGGDNPGISNKANSGTLELRRTKGSNAHKGSALTRRME